MRSMVKKIVLAAAVFVLAGVMIAANIVLAVNSTVIHSWFDKSTSSYDNNEQQAVITQGDELVRDIAEQSMVLLRNENDTLPLDKETQGKVNLFGWSSSDAGFLLVGGGSGGTTLDDDIAYTLQEALTQEGVEYNPELSRRYADFSDTNADANNTQNTLTSVQNPDESFYDDALMTSAKEYSDTAIVVISRYGSENSIGGNQELYNITGYQNGTYLELTDEERIIFEKINEYEFGNVIVLLNVCNLVECGFLEDYDVDACLYVGMPGQSGAIAIPRIIYGDVAPSGRNADLYAYDWQTYNPVMANNYYIAENVVYAEGIYYGYRWYETADAEGYFDGVTNGYGSGYDAVVQYPFGYGLGYADFEYIVESWPSESGLTADGEYSVSVRVANVGDRTGNTYSGRETVQLYVTPPYHEGEIEKSHVSLLALGKTAELDPGESQVITLTFSAYDMASYDSYDANKNGFAGWELDEGSYELKLMSDSHNVVTALGEGSEAATFSMNAAADIKIASDPVTGAEVVNRFTGSDAYGGLPIDGTVSSAKSDADNIYMSRADGFADFPTARASSAVTSVNSDFVCDIPDEISAEASRYSYGSGGPLRLTTLEDGSAPEAGDLDGSSRKPLVYNDELLRDLWDYESETWDVLLDQMSKTEIVTLIQYGGFQTSDIVSIGKPRILDRDGPAGFNNSVSGGTRYDSWTAFPSESLIACSWSNELCYYMGLSQGAVGNSTGVNGWYAPGVNLHRSQYNSRNFEYYSEDPVLSGVLAAEVIRGAKNNNLYCYMKHFAASESGRNPYNWNTWLTEQTLREIYLKPFEIAVKDGGANAVMTAFSNIGNIWAGGNAALCTDILRGEWGFKGSVITDYFAKDYMVPTTGILAGNDLYLAPGGVGTATISLPNNDLDKLYAARRAVKNILYTLVDTYMTATEYRDGDGVDDRYNVEIGTFVPTEAPFSPLFVFLWVLIDVVLAAGIAVCAVFFIKKPKSNTSDRGE